MHYLKRLTAEKFLKLVRASTVNLRSTKTNPSRINTRKTRTKYRVKVKEKFSKPARENENNIFKRAKIRLTVDFLIKIRESKR